MKVQQWSSVVHLKVYIAQAGFPLALSKKYSVSLDTG